MNPEQPEFHFDVKPDFSQNEINAVTSGNQDFDIALPSTSIIKRELKEDLSSDESPQKAAKLTVAEICSEALARISGKIFFLFYL